MIGIGERIKSLRTRNNLTLEELASRCELTKGFLSQLEHDLNTPSITTLNDICEVLGISMSDFFAQDKEQQIVFTDDDFFIDEKDNMIIKWIVPNAQSNKMEPILLRLKPKGASKWISPHEGEEFGYVLFGRVSLVIGKKKIVIHKGQTFYLKGDKEHFFTNDSKNYVEFLWVSTPPLF